MKSTENKIPRILVITVSAWNNKVGSNTWSTLVSQCESENVANLFIREEQPDNPVCSRYFRISENRVLKSIFKRGIKTGTEVQPMLEDGSENKDLAPHNERYRKMKKHRRYSMLLARELVWCVGKWRSRELDDFLDGFSPDVILYSMEGYIHLNRIIEYSLKRTGASGIGYFWDDNFTYRQSKKIGYKIYRFFQRRSLKNLAKVTDKFFAISDMTKKEADSFFGIDCRILTKPLNSAPEVKYNAVDKPIDILYTGNLLIGRDRSLLRLVNAIRDNYRNDFVIDVYTQTLLDDKIKAEIEQGGVCRIHPPIPQNEVLKKQKEADLLLFLEDIDGPDAHTARLSFSTKITDYLSSGKAIFAIGCRETAPMHYFIDNESAFVATNDKEIKSELIKISQAPDLLTEYAKKSVECGIRNHSKDKILGIFNDTLNEVLKNKDK